MALYLDRLISLIIFFSIGSLLFIDKGGILLGFIFILSLVGLFVRRHESSPLKKWEKLFLTSFISFFLVILANVIYFDGALRDIDTMSRFIFAIPIFLYFRKSNISNSYLFSGLYFAAILFGANVFSQKYAGMEIIEFSKPGQVGIISLYGGMLGTLFYFLINKNNGNIRNFVYFVAGYLGIGLSVLMSGRGVWLASIVTFMLLFIFNPMHWTMKEKFKVSLTVIVSVFLLYISPQSGMKSKIDTTLQNSIKYIQEEDHRSSLGARLEMWKGALLISKENIFFGIGENNFKEHKAKLIDKGILTEWVARYNHPHGEYLATLTEQGIIGLFFLIYVLFFPIIFSLIQIRNKSQISDYKIVMVASISLHFALYSLTNGVFDHQNTTLFYSIFISIFLALWSRDKNIKEL